MMVYLRISNWKTYIYIRHSANPSPCPAFLTIGVERSQEGDASDENDEAEFFDAMEDSPAFITVTASGNIQHKWDSVQCNLRTVS